MKAAIIASRPDAFWTNEYGAFRWDKHLYSANAPWYLVSMQSDFDVMRGFGHIHVPCTTDDFGNLVGVA